MLKEGSYIYSEAAAIPLASANKIEAVVFLEHLLDPTSQQQVIYKLGLMPANTKTFLPMHFTNLPFSTYSVNNKLSRGSISKNHTQWLEFWKRLFSYGIM